MDNEKVYYIIREDVLPEAVKKTIIMKKALEENPKLSILEASKRFDLSRSAFYKYKDTSNSRNTKTIYIITFNRC